MNGRYRPYFQHQHSGVDWLGNIPTGWIVARVKQYADVTDGSHHSPAVKSDGYPFISVTEVRHDDIDFEGCKRIASADYHRLVREGCKPEPGNLLLTKDGTIGRAVIVRKSDPPFVILSSLGLISNLRDVDGIFLRYFLISGICIDQMNSLIHGSALRRLTIKKINELVLTFPEPTEQIQIANFLDYETAKIDALIEKQQQLITLLKEKRQAVISHAVTKGLNPDAPMRDSGVEWLGEVPEHWNVRPLKWSIQPGSSISYGIVQPGEPLEDGVPFVQTTNMSRGTFDLESLQRTTKQIADAYPRSRLRGGEVLLGIRASIGAAYVVPPHLRGCNLSRGVARISPADDLTAEYLVWYLCSTMVSHFWGLSRQGSTFSEVSIETVKELYLPMPSLDQQVAISAYLAVQVSKFDTLEATAERQNLLLQERRTALISAAVTGKIDVRNWKVPESQPQTETA